MRAITHHVAFLAMAVGSLLACKESDECQSARDCDPGFRCEARACVASSGGGIGQDSGPRADAGVVGDASSEDGPDGALDAGGDAGGPDDAGAGDADAGPVDSGTDGGDAGDGGLPAPGPLPSSGLFIFGDYQTAVPIETGFGALVDRTGVTYAVTERSYADLEGRSCLLRTQRIVSGAPGGLAAQGLLLFAQGTRQMRAFAPASGAGRFELSAPAMPGFFTMSGQILFRILSNGAAGGVEEYITTLQPPPFFSPLSPPLGSTVRATGPIDLSWNLNPAAGLQDVFVELHDPPRAVVLRCDTTNDGAYQVPPAAVAAWAAEVPASAALLDVGYEFAAPVPDMQLRGGSQVPLSVRLQQAARYTVQ